MEQPDLRVTLASRLCNLRLSPLSFSLFLPFCLAIYRAHLSSRDEQPFALYDLSLSLSLSLYRQPRFISRTGVQSFA